MLTGGILTTAAAYSAERQYGAGSYSAGWPERRCGAGRGGAGERKVARSGMELKAGGVWIQIVGSSIWSA